MRDLGAKIVFAAGVVVVMAGFVIVGMVLGGWRG